jgi:predicted transcriptional regulator
VQDVKLEVGRMLVRDAMTRNVVTVSPEATLKAAAGLLAEHAITSMPVVDDTGRLIGVVSEADVVRESLVVDHGANLLVEPVSQAAATSCVAEVMTALPVTVHPDSDLAEAAQLMTESTVKSLPVVEDSRLVGIVSRTDVVRMLARRDQRVEADIDDLIRSAGMDWLVEVEDGVAVLEGAGRPSDVRLARALVFTVPGVVGVRFRSSTHQS